MLKIFEDKYTILARKKKLRSRAWFKLKEIQEKEKIFFKGINVVDLGCAPGGWSKYAANFLDNTGLIIACDILPIKPIKGVYFIQGDLSKKNFLDKFLQKCKKKN